MNLLELSAVTKRFGSLVAIDGVDLTVGAGTLTAVVGPSGSGKTTLLRLIAGFEAPDAGLISFDGKTLANGSEFMPAHRRGIGLVAQEGALFPHLSAADNIGFGIEDRRARPGMVEALLRAVDLDPAVGGKRPHELSGGQQQRVALARALARRPRLMLLDEPFSALDAGLRSQMREMVKARLAADGITGILVTHDQQEALSFADQLVVLDHGTIIQAGSPRELYLQPRTEVLARFLGDALFVDAEVSEGVAESPIGRIRVGRGTPDGRARIMLRPEQVRLVPWTEGSTRAEIQSASFEGPVTVVVFRVGDALFTLKCPSADAPVAGTAGITIIGTGHAFSRDSAA